ncbi:MAG: hypothetical protein K0R12_365 [Gammaproteobacteria bacterium]|jgi:ComF family protein|nr:hypothetical protein [Gammaproteobacteria bacterium]
MKTTTLHYLLTRLCPQQCAVCGLKTQSPDRLCNRCLEVLPYLKSACYQCANPLPELRDSILCGKCLKDPPLFSQTIACLFYEIPVTEWIYQLKFQHHLLYAAILSDLLLKKLKQLYIDKNTLPECIIPIPLHAKRTRERGYNQAVELAKPIAKAFKLPLIKHSIKRQRSTKPQMELAQKERIINVKNAFVCPKPLPYRHVAILDDVMTTGSTANAFAKILRENGVEKITVWCGARTTLK